MTSMTARAKAPFRADHVGSLLRPAPLKEARAKHEKGEITAEQLKEVEDREIEKVIRKQEEVGLAARDRRRAPALLVAVRFLQRARWRGALFHRHGHRRSPGSQTKAESVRVVGKVDFSGHPHLEHFRFVKDACQGGRRR